ncbi:MAG: agmatine deiminase family protein [Idiomarina sp.]|nr:agmatine deiminase family protein [Idiomarina sp.]
MSQWLPEWQQARAVWLRWPSRSDIWPNHGQNAQTELLSLMKQLCTRAIPVQLQCVPQDAEKVTDLLASEQLQSVTVHAVDFGDIWLRDCAPFICSDGTVKTFAFDSWGGIDDQAARDEQAREWLTEHLDYQVEPFGAVLEGGALQTDGAGTALACAGSILFRPGNSELSARGLAAQLSNALGIEQVLWLPGKLNADETGGHVDNLACFLTPTTIAVVMPESPSHPDYSTCRRVAEYLRASKNIQGKGFEIVEIPLPEMPNLSRDEAASIEARAGIRRRIAGMSLMASYLNFLRLNLQDMRLIIVPAFALDTDELARSAIQRALPEYEVILAPARNLLVGGGAWHCASWVEPAL